MFVILRRDLGWPTGPLIAQACHATSAVLQRFRHDPRVEEYLSEANLSSMHKVVLQVKTLAKLQAVRDALAERDLCFHEWVEQPENEFTAIATIPYEKDELTGALKKCELFR